MAALMSTECYQEDTSEITEMQSNLDSEIHPENPVKIGDSVNNDNNLRLHEMGEALEIAENRCNTLKEQLDQMKTLYRERSNLMKSSSRDQWCGDNKPIIRQNSDAIATDTSGAAVLTINNILNGITNSINRLSELHTYMESDTLPMHSRKKTKQMRGYRDTITSPIDVRREKFTTDRRSASYLYKDHKKEQPKRTRRTKQCIPCNSLSQLRKNVQPKHKISPREEASTASIRARKRNKRTPKSMRRAQPMRRPGVRMCNDEPMSTNHLVEIYHNSSLEYADSEDQLPIHDPVASVESRYCSRPSIADMKKKWSRKTSEHSEDEFTAQPIGSETYQDEMPRTLSPIKEQTYNTEGQPTQTAFQTYPGYVDRRYQTPTISSRMKQVARGYFRNFSCRAIPFCAAKSTSPSHNIGINIQQVMSIIKGRQAVNGISPTLAHNIGIAADRLNNESISAMMTHMNSRYDTSGYQYSLQAQQMPCPMQHNMNYQQLQDMAVEMPNESTEEDCNNETDIEKEKLEMDQTIKMQKSNNSNPVRWTVDKENRNNCTCASSPGVHFNQVMDKYRNYRTTPNQTTRNSQQSFFTRMQKPATRKFKHIRSVYAQYNNRRPSMQQKEYMMNTAAHSDHTDYLPLNGKEKLLKGVLMNLHEDFAALSEKHEELCKLVEDENRTNPVSAEELEALEKKLNEKEIEIQMVMSLYTEVVNLKQQVKILQEKAGMTATLIQHSKTYSPQMNIHCGPNCACQHPAGAFGGCQYANVATRPRETKTNAAMHLTKLLRQIQAYQDVYKTGGK